MCHFLPVCSLFQFALPRGERQHTIEIKTFNAEVSIRAPAWGATIDFITNHNFE